MSVPDVQSRVGADLLERDGVTEALIGSGRKRAARLRLRQNVDDLRVRHRLVLHDERAVQMFAALGRDVNAHGRKHTG